MKLQATISMLSTMLLMGLHGATSPDSCRDKAHVDMVTTDVSKTNKSCKSEGQVPLTVF